MAIRPFKTNRNLSQYAAKKVLGKAHTRGDISDLQESLPSNIQLSAATIFADPIPAGPADEVPTLVWDSVETIQYVSLDAVEIAGTRYDADSSSDLGGEDTNNTNGPHAWYLKLPDDYETVSAGSHSGVGEGYFINAQPLYETLGKLQIVPTNFYINPADPAINPYAPKIYTWDGSTESSKSNIPLTPNDSLDWFFDPYNGIVFFQEHDASDSLRSLDRAGLSLSSSSGLFAHRVPLRQWFEASLDLLWRAPTLWLTPPRYSRRACRNLV